MADDDLNRFSGEEFTADEWKRLRRDLALLERIKPLLNTYERGSTITRFFVIVGAWLIGAGVALLGVITSLRELGWWFKAGGGP
jgi:hypothetical protein